MTEDEIRLEELNEMRYANGLRDWDESVNETNQWIDNQIEILEKKLQIN